MRTLDWGSGVGTWRQTWLASHREPRPLLIKNDESDELDRTFDDGHAIYAHGLSALPVQRTSHSRFVHAL